MSRKSHMHILNNVSPVLHELPFSLPGLASLNKQFWQAWSCNQALESLTVSVVMKKGLNNSKLVNLSVRKCSSVQFALNKPSQLYAVRSWFRFSIFVRTVKHLIIINSMYCKLNSPNKIPNKPFRVFHCSSPTAYCQQFKVCPVKPLC